jgi:hypothetical protein
MKILINIALVFVLISCDTKLKKHSDDPSKVDGSIIDYNSLKADLEEMYFKDQEIRRIITDSIGFDSPNTQQYFDKMMEIDSINQFHLKEILSQYGWIPQSKIGEKASDAIFYIIQHSDIKLMQQYYPQLKELAKKGEAKNTHAAMMEDRLLMWHGKKQKYGTQASSILRDNNKMIVWPIEKPDSVNIFRKAMGFELTVEENAKRLNAEYNRDESLPKNKK